MHMQGLGQVSRQGGISPGHLKVLQAAERTAQRMIEFTGGNRAKIASELRKEDPRLPGKWRKLTGVLRRRGVDKAAERALLLTIADAAVDRTIEMGEAMQQPEVPSLSGAKSFFKKVGGWIGDTVNNFACDPAAQEAVGDLSFQGKASGEGGTWEAGAEASSKAQVGMSAACAGTGGRGSRGGNGGPAGGGGAYAPPQQDQGPIIIDKGGDGMPEWMPIALLGLGGFMVVALLIVAMKD